MFTPGLAIFYLATILKPDHVCGVHGHACGVRAGFSDILSAGGWCLGAERRLSSPSPSRRQDNMDRASQVLAGWKRSVVEGLPKITRSCWYAIHSQSEDADETFAIWSRDGRESKENVVGLLRLLKILKILEMLMNKPSTKACTYRQKSLLPTEHILMFKWSSESCEESLMPIARVTDA